MPAMTLNRVGVLSAGKIFGILYAAIGLLIGIPFALISLLGLAAQPEAGGEAAIFGLLFGVGSVVIWPLLYGVLGFITAVISAFLYNLLAGMVGGLELDLS